MFISSLHVNVYFQTDVYASKPRTIFHRALEAIILSWGDSQLQQIIKQDGCPCRHIGAPSDMYDAHGYFVWSGNYIYLKYIFLHV